MSSLKRAGLILTAEGAIDFQNSLKNINAQLKENYSAMKLSQELMGKNASLVDKMSNKNRQYTRDLELSKSKVHVLTQELEELTKAEGNNEEAIAKKRRELNWAEKDVQFYGKRLDEIEKKLKDGTYAWEDFANKLDNTGQKMTSAGKKMSIFSAAYTGAVTLAVKSASDWESAWAGVLKVTEGTPEQLKEIHDGIRELASELPYTAEEIAAVSEEAGKLGVSADDVLVFTKTMLDMGVATDLTTTEAATKMAQFANIMNMPLDQVDKLGASIVDLGNNFATTEPQILDMSLRLAGTGKQAGLSEPQVLAMATAMSTVGIEAQAGGTSMSKLMTNMQLAVETGSKELDEFANVAGVTADEFKVAFEENASKAILMFVDGLAKSEEQGTTAIKVLDDMNIKEVRLRDTLLRLTNANDTFRDSLEVSESAWDENAALAEEAEIRYETFESQVAGLKSAFNELAISFGEIVLPVLTDVINSIKGAVDTLNGMDPAVKKTILIVGGLVAAIGPLLIIVGKIATGISAIIGLAIKLGPLFTGIGNVIGTITTFIAGLSAGWLILIAAVAAGVAYLILNWESVKEWLSNFINWLSEKYESVKEAIGNFISWVKDGITEFGTNIKEKITQFIDWFLGFLEGPIDFIKNMFLFIVAIFAMALEAIWEVFKPGIDKAKEVMTSFGEIVTGIWQTIKDFVIKVVDNIKDKWQTGINYIKDNIITPLSNFFSGIFEGVYNTVSGSIEKIRSGFATLGNAIKEIFRGVKDTVVNIFSVIGNVIKTPINGIIKMINTAIRSMNKVKVPKWVPGIGGSGINFKEIKLLAKGGNLLTGTAIAGERGPELLESQGGRTRVTPLSDGGGAIKRDLIDYKLMAKEIARALRGTKFVLDEDGFVRLVDDRLLEVL